MTLFQKSSWLIAFAACITSGFVVWRTTADESTRARKEQGAPEQKQENGDQPPESTVGVYRLSDLVEEENVDEEASKAFEEFLATNIDVKFEKSTLDDVLAFLSRKGRFTLRLAPKQDLDGNSRVTLQATNVPIEYVLRRAFDDQPGFEVSGKNVLVTFGAQEPMQTRRYDVRDLASPKASRRLQERGQSIARVWTSRPSGSEYDWLVQVAHSQSSGPWMHREGIGGWTALIRGTLVVHHNRQNHGDIEELLRGLRLARAGNLKDAAFFLAGRNYPHEQEARIRRKLKERTSVDFRDAPLRDVLKHIETEFEASFQMGHGELDKELQKALDRKTTIQAKDILWSELLDRVESQINLNLFNQELILLDGTFTLTVADGCRSDRTAIYDVSDFLKAGLTSNELHDLADCVSDGAWFVDVGVNGTMDVNEDLGVAIVSLTEDGHRQFVRLLLDARKDLGPDLAQIRARFGKPIDRDVVELRIYEVGDAALARQIADAIPRFVQPKSWNDQSVAAVAVVNTAVLVRHKSRVHDDINRFIHGNHLLSPDLLPGGGFF